MRYVWMSIAGICIVAAGIALWLQHLSAAFVIATVGVMAWFLNYRTEVKKVLNEAEPPLAEPEETNQEDENS